MRRLLLGLLFVAPLLSNSELAKLFQQLEQVDRINHQIEQQLPFIYNYELMGGYFTMPSARVAGSGMTAIGGASLPPYNLWSFNFQMFSHIELSGNYRVYRGVQESNFGYLGFGNDADRTANAKFVLYKERESFRYLPSFALGFEDFYGSRRFYSLYLAATKQLLPLPVELTLGWGKGRIKGFFGGLSWTPFYESDFSFFKNFSFVAEYDANDYKHHPSEHPQGRESKWPINIGFVGSILDCFQFKMSSLRGKEIAAAGSLYYNFGQSKGFFPKIDNPPLHTAPVNVEPIGTLRTEKELARELAFAFSGQGLDLYHAYLFYDDQRQKGLWLKVVNMRYREESQMRERIEYLLSTLLPSDIASVTVVVEADGTPTQGYRFRGADLARFRLRQISEYELRTLSPMGNPQAPPNQYEGTLIYNRKKDPWVFTVRPRALTFFGSTTGKFKYSLGVIAGPEGYILDSIFYKLQASYNIKSSINTVGDVDVYNPSQLPNVRSDTIRYFQSNSVSLEQAYIQKGWHLGGGVFTRLAGGYFEPAYGGGAWEALLYPARSPFAIGLEAANVYKRTYDGLGFTTKIRHFQGVNAEYEHFIGYQYFLDLYYYFKPLQLDFEVNIGKFLARDVGAKFQIGRYFPSGMEFAIWYTITNANDVVNGKRYYDKGVFFLIPLDIFLKKSSRSMLGYAMSAWLRDEGARAATGKRLYRTIQSDRMNL